LRQAQARREDLAAGRAKNQEGPKMRRRGHILKIQYWTYVATRGPNVKWGTPISNGRARHHWPPCWRRRCTGHLIKNFVNYWNLNHRNFQNLEESLKCWYL